jgi:hypothetical protein
MAYPENVAGMPQRPRTLLTLLTRLKQHPLARLVRD